MALGAPGKDSQEIVIQVGDLPGAAEAGYPNYLVRIDRETGAMQEGEMGFTVDSGVREFLQAAIRSGIVTL